MRIGIDARLADYVVGGIARYTTQLATALTGLGSRHEIIAVRSRRPKVTSPTIGCDATFAAWTPPHHRFEAHALAWELGRARLDVLHSPDFIPPGSRGWRSVITVHDLAFLRMPSLLTPASRRYYRGIHRAVRTADAIIAVSKATARDVRELTDAAPEKVHVVYEAADAELAPLPNEVARRAVCERHGITDPYLLFVGTLEPRKNIPKLLEAFASVRREHPVRLVLAGGRGWLADDIFRTVQRLALDDGVQFLGTVGATDLRALYCAAEALVLPSLYEGFGLPPLEAMACGVPVVVSHAGSLAEVVGDGGTLVNPEDALDIAQGIHWVLDNPAYRDALIARGLARAATFSWDRAARETMAVYESVLGERLGGG